jgi:hypothetical protein
LSSVNLRAAFINNASIDATSCHPSGEHQSGTQSVI